MMHRVFLAAIGLLASVSLVFAGSSNSLIDVSPDGKRLVVANSDNGTVSVVDLTTNKVVHEIKVGDKPEGVAWIGNGPLALATVYREDKVVWLNTEKGTVVDALKVFDEPYGVIVDKTGKRAWVTLDYPGSVLEIDLTTKKIRREIKVGDFIRGIALSADEKRLYISEFYTARMHAVDLTSWKVADTWESQPTYNLARHVAVHPTLPKAYVSHIRSRIDIIDGSGSIFPQLTIYDLVPPNESKRRTSITMDTYNGVYVVTNPWEAALSPDGKQIYTIYAGTDDMNISDVRDDNYKEIERRGHAVTVGKNPRAVRVSPDGRKVYIYNTLDFEVGVYTALTMKSEAKISVCKPVKTPEWVRGKVLFSTAKYPLTSRRWIACASCHPDGLSDGRVWHNPEGLRKTPAMMGLAHTHPIHWSADRDEVQDFEYTIQSKLMQGAGFLGASKIKAKVPFKPTELDEITSGRNSDLDALAIYCNSFEFTLSPHMVAPGKLSESAERGKKIFFNEKVGCASCHSGPYYTDSSLKKPFKLHDVGTGLEDKSEKIGPKYDTPTLLGVYRTAPYLHHGKAKTLKDVVTTCNKDDKHGATSQLKENEVDDLVEFLKSLPYETPPNRTDNTVKYRVGKEEKRD